MSLTSVLCALITCVDISLLIYVLRGLQWENKTPGYYSQAFLVCLLPVQVYVRIRKAYLHAPSVRWKGSRAIHRERYFYGIMCRNKISVVSFSVVYLSPEKLESLISVPSITF